MPTETYIKPEQWCLTSNGNVLNYLPSRIGSITAVLLFSLQLQKQLLLAKSTKL